MIEKYKSEIENLKKQLEDSKNQNISLQNEYDNTLEE